MVNAGSTKAEAASSLRCSEKKVERLISIGTLEAQRIGRRVFVTRESLGRLLEPIAPAAKAKTS